MQRGTNIESGGKRLKPGTVGGTSERPTLTIITPTFNSEESLESSIQSVVNQHCDDIEYIIVDGCSNDGTLGIIRKYDSSIDYWVSEPDSGIYDAMTKGVQLARGRWLYFLGSDDVISNSFRDVFEFLDDEQAVYYGNVFMTGSKRLYDGPFGPWKLSRRNICQQAILYPRSAVDVRQFSLRYKLFADWEFNMRTYADSKFRFQFIPVTIAKYNDVSGKSSVGFDAEFWIDYGEILRKCMPLTCYAWYKFKAIVRPWSIPKSDVQSE